MRFLPSSLGRSWAGDHRALLLAVLALVLGVSLQIRALGLGRLDNNDWLKYASSFVSHPVGLPAVVSPDDRELWNQRYTHRWLRYWQAKSLIEPPTSRWDTGPIFLLWLPSYALMRWLAPDSPIDLLLLGLPLRLGLVAGFVALAWMLARRAPPGQLETATMAGALVLLACSTFDVSNLSYSSSFFRESAAQLFELWLLVAFVGSDTEIAARRWWLAALAALTLTSATVHGVLALALALVWVTLAPPARRRLLGPLALGVLTAVGFNVLAADPNTVRANSYHGLFLGLLERSSKPSEHLARLGLPETALERMGHGAFEPRSQELIESFPQAFRHRAVLGVALREPLTVPRLMFAATPALGAAPGYLAKVEPGVPRHVWRQSDARRTLILLGLDAGPVLLAMATLLAALAGLVCWHGKDPWQLLLARLTLLSGAILWVELLANVLGDGMPGVGRHLFLARLALDQTLVLGGLLLVVLASSAGTWLLRGASTPAQRS